MGLTPDALYRSVFEDVKEYLPFGPVGLGDIPPDASYKQFASAYLLSSIKKKFLSEKGETADLAAKEKFLASNKKCKNWKLPDMFEIDRELIGEFRRAIDDFLHPSAGRQLLFDSYYDLIEHGRVGPGAAVGARGNSLYSKLFSSQITTTSAMLNFVFNSYFEWYPRFDEALAESRRTYGHPRVVNGSTVSFVPKTTEISRMIAVEPSLNMFFQLGLGTLLEQRLRTHFNVDLADQPFKNRALAQVGSRYGLYSTIDLSSASDSISINMVKAMFPSWFFETLMELRSPYCKIGSDTVELHMISTMGNGFTFPLQTVIFASLIRASYRVAGLDEYYSTSDGSRCLQQNWACFGDDLIVHRKSYRLVIRLLTMLGFEVNGAKTFFEGPFRESCGADWFFGQPVRPVFVKKLDSLQDLVVTINALNEWTANTGISLCKTIKFLLSGIRVPFHTILVPRYENPDSGIKVPLSYMPSSARVYDRNKSLLYRPFRVTAQRIKVGERHISVPRRIKSLIFNPGGLEISFLYGELDSYGISVRHDRPRYRQSRVPSPYWDWDDNLDLLRNNKADRRRWETAVHINMCSPA